MCEDDRDTQLVFFHINELKPGAAQLKALTQSITDERRKGVPLSDRVKAYRSLMVNVKDTEDYKQCGIALRETGGIDFYFDFRLVETSEREVSDQTKIADSTWADLKETAMKDGFTEKESFVSTSVLTKMMSTLCFCLERPSS